MEAVHQGVERLSGKLSLRVWPYRIEKRRASKALAATKGECGQDHLGLPTRPKGHRLAVLQNAKLAQQTDSHWASVLTLRCTFASLSCDSKAPAWRYVE